MLVFEVFLGLLAAAALALAFVPETVTRRERPSLRFTGLAIPADGRREFIGAGVAAFAAYTLNGLFASLVPRFTTAILHHPITRSRVPLPAPSSLPAPSPRWAWRASTAGRSS